jgi:hypothetical protein
MTFAPSSNATALPDSVHPLLLRMVAGFFVLLLLLILPSCADEPPKPMSAEEAALKQEQKDTEHRVFYEGWLHPN